MSNADLVYCMSWIESVICYNCICPCSAGLLQVSIDKAGYNVLLKDTSENGLARGEDQIYKK